jgi:archaellin
VKLFPCLLVLSAAVFASGAFPTAAHAQGKTDYTLNEGQVHFRVPPTWSAIMEKSDGNPQAIAFQVPDAAAQGSEDTASVTVKTRQLTSAAEFASTVINEFERAKTQGGYENDTSNNDKAVHQYFVVRGKTRYLVRDSFFQSGMVSVEVHCLHPLLTATAPTWNTEFDRACDGVVASLKH